MSGMFSPTRSFGSTMRSISGSATVKDSPKMADLSITTADVHPVDWARSTVRDMDVAASHRAGSAMLRTATQRRRDFQDHSLRSTENRVNLALSQRIDETRAAIESLEASLAQMNAEIETQEQAKVEVQQELDDKQVRVKVPRECLARRSMRPKTERVLDEAEIELTAEVREYEAAIKRLTDEVRKMDADLRGLRAAKFKIEKNLKDKYDALALDEECMNVRSPQ